MVQVLFQSLAAGGGDLVFGQGRAAGEGFLHRDVAGVFKFACVGILILLGIVWAELAVGLIGTPLAGS